jgi:protein TonB
MPVKPAAEAPLLPPVARRPLVALWLSLGLHGAVIAMVQLAPPASVPATSIIEARLESREAAATTVPEAPAAAEVEPETVSEPLPVPEPVAEKKPEPVPLAVEPEAPEPAPLLPQPTPAPAVATAPPKPPAAAASPALPGPAAPERESPRPLLEIPSAVDLAYYGAREVDVLPRALREIRPEYPAEADRRRVSGNVRLQLKLEADGRVSDVEVVEANPPGLFEESALAAFRQARFSPAQRNGRPVRARIVIDVEYDYEGRPR